MLTRIAILTTALILVLPGVASAQNLVGHWTFNGNQNDSSGRNTSGSAQWRRDLRCRQRRPGAGLQR